MTVNPRRILFLRLAAAAHAIISPQWPKSWLPPKCHANRIAGLAT